MYADTIVAGKMSVTGSIGVAGGWVYDKGLSAKLGLTGDYVKRGEHAALGSGVRIPFTGLRIPSRNMTDDERSIVETRILEHYDDFVNNVAESRNLPVDSVRQIAEGRYYSGVKGKKNGLVDEIGGLMTALSIARKKAGFEPDEEIDIIEIPKSMGLINTGRLLSPMRRLPEVIVDEPVYQYLKYLTEHPGQPLPMLIPGTYPDLDE
jgi:protease-4